MRSILWIGLGVLGIAGISPYLLQAQVFSPPCCATCQLPIVTCACQRTRPVVQTHLREEKVTTYHDVLQTRFREEHVIEHTPVTTIEDRVETVWVPQQVTKKVARTVIVPQAKSRTIPYQVLQRVPQTTTRLVPYQTVHHVTETIPMTFVPTATPIVSHTVITPTPFAAIPVAPPLAGSPSQTAAAPRQAPPLSPEASRSGWQTIPPRSGTSSADRLGGYEADYERPVPPPIDNEPGVRKTSWRGNVPGAVAGWNYDGPVRR